MAPGGHIGGTNIKDMPGGWGVAPTFNVNRWFGLTLDTGGHYGDNASVATIMVGPKFSLRLDKVTPFAEVLFGLHRLDPGSRVNAESRRPEGRALRIASDPTRSAPPRRRTR